MDRALKEAGADGDPVTKSHTPSRSFTMTTARAEETHRSIWVAHGWSQASRKYTKGEELEQERHRLIERTKAGLDRARAQGKRLGRPLASPVRTVVWATAPGSLGPTGC